MDEIVDEIIELDFDELENLDFLVDKLFGLCVHYNNVKYDF